MKKIFLTFLLISISILLPSKLESADKSNASFKLLMHKKQEIFDKVDLKFHLIALKFPQGAQPLAYLGIDFKVLNWLKLEFAVGYTFSKDSDGNYTDEPIVAIMLTPEYKDFYGWLDYEHQTSTWKRYMFAQVQYKISPLLHVGFETENWGDYRSRELWSKGFGPNVLLRFGDSFGVDIACQWRGIKKYKAGMAARIQIIF